MTPIRVVLADDHTLVRAGLHALLHIMEGIDVVAEASDGHEALELIAVHQPDVVLMDIAMPGLNGLEATARIVPAFPHVRVLILSMYANEEFVVQALRAGRSGRLPPEERGDCRTGARPQTRQVLPGYGSSLFPNHCRSSPQVFP